MFFLGEKRCDKTKRKPLYTFKSGSLPVSFYSLIVYKLTHSSINFFFVYTGKILPCFIGAVFTVNRADLPNRDSGGEVWSTEARAELAIINQCGTDKGYAVHTLGLVVYNSF